MKPQFWTPEKEWEGQDAILIGGGPSLSGYDFSRIQGRNVIACNDAFRLGQRIAKVCVFGDATWWQKNKWDLQQFPGKVVTNSPTMAQYDLQGTNVLLTARVRDGIHFGPTLGWNYSTGALAINLAISMGAVRIFLLGYDLMKRGNQPRWHRHNLVGVNDASFPRFLRGFNAIRQCQPNNVEVFNVTDGSSQLNCFPRMTFDEFHDLIFQDWGKVEGAVV